MLYGYMLGVKWEWVERRKVRDWRARSLKLFASTPNAAELKWARKANANVLTYSYIHTPGGIFVIGASFKWSNARAHSVNNDQSNGLGGNMIIHYFMLIIITIKTDGKWLQNVCNYIIIRI